MGVAYSVIRLKLKAERDGIYSLFYAAQRDECFCFSEMTFRPLSPDGNDGLGVNKCAEVVTKVKKSR